MSDLGVYLHYPWCRKLCPYCDFAVEVGAPEHDAYLAAVLRELEARAGRFSGNLVSIYLGGGTPSLWDPACVGKAIAAIELRFGGTPREITLEANPTDCTVERLAAWRDAGVTRLSIGVQSLVQDELVTLGRDHRFGDGMAAIERVLAFGGFTVSADFILGVPPQPRWRSPDSLRATGTMPDWVAVTALPIDHLSVYELTIEDRTAFGQRVKSGRLVPLDEDVLTELYVATHAALTAAGFEHYEISSYARPGKRAVHNSLYWVGAPFLGLGVGAASLVVAADGSGERATNPRKARDYMAAPGVPAETTAISAAEMAADRAWLGMRTVDGVLEASLPAAVTTWLVDEKLAVRRPEVERAGLRPASAQDRICPTLRGFLMADRIAARIVDAL